MAIIREREKKLLDSEILSALSHELRGLLAAIKGYATMLADYLNALTAEETKEYIQAIENAADTLTKLVDSFWDILKLEEGKLNLEKTTVAMGEIIRSAASQSQSRNSQHVILTAVDNDLPLMYLDPKRISQALEDVIDSAVLLSPHGTEVLVAAKANREEIEIGVTSCGQGVAGTGFYTIPDFAAHLDQTAPPKGKIIKLKLYCCQALVEKHGGRLWIESSPGKGMTFKFTLPIRIF